MNLRRKLAYMLSKSSKGRLPDEYQEVEYIESTGTQRLDTGVVATVNSGLKAYVDTSSEVNSSTKVLIGANGSANGGNWFGATTVWTVGAGGISNVASDNRIQTTIFFGDYIEYDLNGVNYKRQNTNFGSGGYGSVNLFSAKTSNAYWFKGRLYSTKIWNEDTLVRNLVPCYRKSDGVVGMYDLTGSICPLTNSPFYINAGTGEFEKGGDV